MAREFADALQYIHTQFHPDCIIIHRDLKPDNIGMVTSILLCVICMYISMYMYVFAYILYIGMVNSIECY